MYYSFEVAYFIGFLPIKFITQEGVQFDPYCTLWITLFFWINSTIFLSAYFVLYRSGELHHQCLQYGHWRCLSAEEVRSKSDVEVKMYQAVKKYRKHTVVTLGGNYYEALEESNSAKPNEILPALMYVRFLAYVGSVQKSAQTNAKHADNPL